MKTEIKFCRVVLVNCDRTRRYTFRLPVQLLKKPIKMSWYQALGYVEFEGLQCALPSEWFEPWGFGMTPEFSMVDEEIDRLIANGKLIECKEDSVLSAIGITHRYLDLQHSDA